tara:strand:- start:166 stop:588 length:423 start_codon:yes stop_codon:yes gene_type:complete
MKLKINENIAIRSKEIKYKSIKSSGPGGQNINKKSTAISLYFDISNSKSLSNDIKAIVLRTPNKYLTKSGKIIIKVNTYKSQKKNKSEAILRLTEYFKNLMIRKEKRIKTSPKKSSIKKRLDDKRKNSLKKQLRKKPFYE